MGRSQWECGVGGQASSGRLGTEDESCLFHITTTWGDAWWKNTAQGLLHKPADAARRPSDRGRRQLRKAAKNLGKPQRRSNEACYDGSWALFAQVLCCAAWVSSLCVGLLHETGLDRHRQNRTCQDSVEMWQEAVSRRKRKCDSAIIMRHCDADETGSSSAMERWARQPRWGLRLQTSAGTPTRDERSELRSRPQVGRVLRDRVPRSPLLSAICGPLVAGRCDGQQRPSANRLGRRRTARALWRIAWTDWSAAGAANRGSRVQFLSIPFDEADLFLWIDIDRPRPGIAR